MHRLLNYTYIYLIPLLLSACFSLKAFRLNWPAAYRIFSLFLISTLVTESFAIAWKWELYKIATWSFSRSNLWIYNLFVIIRHIFFLFFFYSLLDSKKIKGWIRMLAIPSIVLGIINFIWIETPHTVNNLAMVVSNLLAIIFSLALFSQVLREEKIVQLAKDTRIWLALGILIYYSATLPFFLFFNYLLLKKPVLATSYLYINDGLNILMYTLFLIAFLCRPQSQK